MAQVGFGATLEGVSVGAITELKNVAVGGRSIAVVSYNILSTRNTQNKEGAVTQGPITAEVVFDKAVYEALETSSIAAAGDTWTLTDPDGNTWVGSGFITNLGDVSNGPDAENTYALEITPDDIWTYTKVS